MKCIIVYFSVTGNTELIARTIQKGVKQAAGGCDIVTLKEANWRRLQDYDLIGIGCPVMGFREPGNVRAFINSIRFVGRKHAFAFGTHGTIPEYFFPSIVPRLKRRGLIVIGTYSSYATCYMSAAPFPYPTTGHPDEIDLKEAEDFGREMAARSRRIAAGETGLIPPVPKEPEPGLDEFLKRGAAMERERGVMVIRDIRGPRLEFDKEKCLYPECRLCMDNCPVDGIDLTVKPPVIAKPCMGCMLCAKICPTGAIKENAAAIEAAAARFVKMMPVFYLAELAKAEAEGRFRRLVPVEKIGYDTPIYKLHSKHPQWVIGKGLQ
jgi:flavodoxin/Fe-S-cluster-containing hydrogenase component 2